jgi:allophanate hydrolase subunit 2
MDGVAACGAPICSRTTILGPLDLPAALEPTRIMEDHQTDGKYKNLKDD